MNLPGKVQSSCVANTAFFLAISPPNLAFFLLEAGKPDASQVVNILLHTFECELKRLRCCIIFSWLF